MDEILELLQKNGRHSLEEIAELLDLDVKAVAEKISDWEEDGTILGYQVVVDPERAASGMVTALIDVKITPERQGGFDRLAERIAKFEQVKSCFLMSGAYDLAVVVQGGDLREVARFISEKLSTLDGVVSTATHFQLKVYKQNGLMARVDTEAARLAVAP